MAIRTLDQMVQVAVQGHVVSSSGVSRKVVNVFNYQGNNAALYALAPHPNVATTFLAQVWSFFAAQLHTSYVGDTCFVWFPQVAGDVPTASGTPQSGGKAGARLPLHSAVYAGIGSGLRGRNWNGSKRLSPVSESDVVGDELTAAAWSSWSAAAARAAVSFVASAPFANLRLDPVVYSRTLTDPSTAPMPFIGADITAVAVDHTLGFWRHRRERVVR